MRSEVRATLGYVFGLTDEEAQALSTDELFEMGNGAPMSYLILDKKSQQLYSVIGVFPKEDFLFAEVAFQHGTLKPVAVSKGGRLHYCAPTLSARQ